MIVVLCDFFVEMLVGLENNFYLYGSEEFESLFL